MFKYFSLPLRPLRLCGEQKFLCVLCVSAVRFVFGCGHAAPCNSWLGGRFFSNDRSRLDAIIKVLNTGAREWPAPC